MNPSTASVISHAPEKPGVYLFKNESGRILYVGKAENLHARLKSYLKPVDAKTIRLVQNAFNVETIVTKTETEALVLEDALIKQNQPRYNVRLRDDKKYPYIRITREEYPRMEVTRRVILDGSRYFGPYTDAPGVRKAARLLGDLFGVRSCRYDLRRLKRPCIKYSMGQCAAPHLVMEKNEYDVRVSAACSFLAGDHRKVRRRLLADIRRYSSVQDYEKASRLKGMLDSVESISTSQHVSSVRLPGMDVLGYATFKGKSNITQLKVRRGNVVAVLHYPLKGEYSGIPEESMKAFIKQHYTAKDLTPKIIATSCEPVDRQLLEQSLYTPRGLKVSIIFARRGGKRRLAEMAVENSIHQLRQDALEQESNNRLETLTRVLRLERLPARIEGYDISNIGDKDTVGGMVVFTGGKPDRGQYRRFRMKSGIGQDDARNMAEMIGRRFNHPEWDYPGLVLLDGGRAQLNACRDLVPKNIPVIGLAKKEEELILPQADRPIRLGKDNPALHLLQEIRDEAHRYARTYHRKRRSMSFIKE